jgi:tRNA dimethylallyltransferase
MQVYRQLDIGTAKPTAAERAQVPHHLIDVADLTEPFDAARFVHLASPLIQKIQASGKIPILCGGTGLYFNVYLGGLGTAPAPDPKLRAELEVAPLPALLDELARMDFATFNDIDTANRRRVVRAVEVLRLTGQPFSAQRAAWGDVPAEFQGRCFGLERDRADLHHRIHQRVDEMFARGLVEETRELLKSGLEQNRTAMQAIGYRQVVEHLRKERGLRDTIELVKTKTRQFSKRQGTWFRGQLDLTWIQIPKAEAPETTAQRLIEAMGHDRSN